MRHLPAVFGIYLVSFLFIISWKPEPAQWLMEKHKGFTFYYTSVDKDNKTEYIEILENGIKQVNQFFSQEYASSFNIYSHPHRSSLDSTWQKDWNMPGFKSECWMVASGVASRVDMISPKYWDTQSCEHSYLNTEKTQQLIAHELVHVYHGQQNISKDFSNAEGIDWFVEGLATYASAGQLDPGKLSEIKMAITESKVPETLDKFWTGKLRYSLSGSLVMFIDDKYGRNTIKDLLKFNKIADILSALNTTEVQLLSDWKAYMLSH